MSRENLNLKNYKDDPFIVGARERFFIDKMEVIPHGINKNITNKIIYKFQFSCFARSTLGLMILKVSNSKCIQRSQRVFEMLVLITINTY